MTSTLSGQAAYDAGIRESMGRLIDEWGLRYPGVRRVEPYLPHTPVLDRAACVICHAGMGITQKALAHGVPVVAVPFGRDQPEVARLTRPGVRDAVQRAMKRHEGARRIAQAFAAAGGPGAAADALESLTGQVTPPRQQAPSAR
jgi:UDP:flavonoid glycosyltransferase YjiC (YdhE family)